MELIDTLSVESSNLASIGYSAERQILAVEFKPRPGRVRGPVFHYKGVSQDTAIALLEADSKGGYYARQIKGKFTAERVTGPCSNEDCREEGPIGERCECCNEGEHRALETRYKDQE